MNFWHNNVRAIISLLAIGITVCPNSIAEKEGYEDKLSLSIKMLKGLLVVTWDNPTNNKIVVFEHVESNTKHYDSYLIRARNELGEELFLPLYGTRKASIPRFFTICPMDKKSLIIDINYWNLLHKDYGNPHLEDGNYELWCEYTDDRWEGWHEDFVPLGPIKSNIIEVAVIDGRITSKSQSNN